MENTNLKIKRLPFSRMLKSEIADFVEKTINLIGSKYIESELIAPMYDVLSNKKRDIRLLRLSYGIDTERLRVNKVKSELMLVISAFKLQVRLLSKSEPELEMHQIENAINKHLRYLNRCKNDKQLTQKVAGFFDLVDSNEELETALIDFKLADEVDIMRSVFSQMVEYTRNRVKLLAQRPNVPTKAIVKGMAQAMDNLFKGIEVANIVGELSDGDGEAIDYTPLITELNQLTDMYARSIAIRDANNKRKNKGDDETDGEGESEGELIDEPIDEPEPPTDGGAMAYMQTGGTNHTDNVDDNDDEPMKGRIIPFSAINAPLEEYGEE